MIILGVTEVLSGDTCCPGQDSVALLFVSSEIFNGDRIVFDSSFVNLFLHAPNGYSKYG